MEQSASIVEANSFKVRKSIPPVARECFFFTDNPTHEVEEEKIEVPTQMGTRPRDSQSKLIPVSLAIPDVGIKEIEIDPEYTVRDIKQQIYGLENILPCDQRLAIKGVLLEDNQPIKQYNIPPKAVLDLIICQHRACFFPNTPITLKDGTVKPISFISVGEIVMTCNMTKTTLEPKKVTKISIYQTQSLSEIDLGTSKIECTLSHPFWVKGKGWKAVKPHRNSGIGLLEKGEILLDSKMEALEVKNIRTFELKTIKNVYCLQVDGACNFFVCGVLAYSMPLYVKVLGGKGYMVNADMGKSIQELKKEIGKQINIAPQDQQLYFFGKKLSDNRTLSDYDIRKETTLYLYSHSLANDQSHQTYKPGEIHTQVNVIYHSLTFVLPFYQIVKIKMLRQQIAALVKLPVEEVSLLYKGKFLFDEEKTFRDYGIINDSDIIAIPASNGGRCLNFFKLLENTTTKDVNYLKDSLSSLDQPQLNKFWSEAFPEALNIKERYQNSKVEEIMALLLWTSSIPYEQVNKAIATNDKLSDWATYLKCLMAGLKYMDFYKGRAYFGIKGQQEFDFSNYKKGSILNWPMITNLSRQIDVAKQLSDEEGTIFEIEIVSAKDITKVSIFNKDQGIILLPYSCLEVIDVAKNPGEPTLIRLKEISVPRTLRVLFWVDDQPGNNFHFAKLVEKKSISCVFCTSTKDALRVIHNYRWLLYLEKTEFRIVSDMVRVEEDNVPNFTAGIDLIRELIQNHKYTFEILVFCSDLIKALENSEAAGLVGPYTITNKENELFKFINFESSPTHGKIDSVFDRVKMIWS